MVFYIGALIVLLLDQMTKYAVKTYMYVGESIPVLGDWLRLTSHRNQGAAWGILQGQRWLFVLITLVVVGGIIVTERRTPKDRKWFRIALALLLGGAVGNMVDRMARGEVVDFLDIRAIHYPIFNVADSAIVIAVGLLLVDTFLGSRRSAPTVKEGPR